MASSTQHQIRDNAAELQSYLSELGQWTQDVKRKDEALKGSVAAPTAVPVRGEPSGEPPAVPVPVRGEPSAAPPPRTPAAVASAAAASAGAASAPVADDSADGWRERGNAAFKAGDFRQAEAHYSASLRCAHTAAAFANRAMARLKLGQAAEAEADCTAALALEPTYVKALQRRAAAHSARGQLLQAASDLDTASRLEPGSKALRAERAAAVAAYEASAPAPAPPPTDVPVRPLPQQARAPQPPPVVTPPPPPPVVMPPAASPPKRGKGSIVEVSDGKPVQAAPAPRAPVAALDLEALAAEAAAKVAERPLEAAPRSGLEYEQAWAQAAGRPELQLRLLQLVPPATLPALLKNALSAAVLIAVQRAALTLLLPSAPDDAFAVLRALTTVPRFQMATMLVAGRDKAALQADWEAAVAAAPPQVAEPLRALRASFRV